MEVTWHQIDRLDAAREQIERAAQELSGGGSLVIAATLARAAAQYLSDKLKSLGKRTTLQECLVDVRQFLETDVDWKLWVDLVNEPANMLKHSNRANEPEQFNVFAGQVGLILLVAVADYHQLTGDWTPAMRDWATEWLNAPEQARFRGILAEDQELQALKPEMAEYLGKK